MTYRCEETLRTLVHALAHRSHFKTKLEPTRCPLAQCSLSPRPSKSADVSRANKGSRSCGSCFFDSARTSCSAIAFYSKLRELLYIAPKFNSSSSGLIYPNTIMKRRQDTWNRLQAEMGQKLKPTRPLAQCSLSPRPTRSADTIIKPTWRLGTRIQIGKKTLN